MPENTGYYFDVNSFRNSARVRLMDFETRSVYREVLDEIWLTGAVPRDPVVAAKLLAHVPVEAIERAWPTIIDCLVADKKTNFLTSERMQVERKKRNKIRKIRQAAQRESVKERLRKAKEDRELAKVANAIANDSQIDSKIVAIQDKTSTRQVQVDKTSELRARLKSGFERLWEKYPAKDGRKEAEKHFAASVHTDTDLADIETALANYLKHLRRESWKKPKNGRTWFNNWRDWVNWTESETQAELYRPKGVVL